MYKCIIMSLAETTIRQLTSGVAVLKQNDRFIIKWGIVLTKLSRIAYRCPIGNLLCTNG